MTYLYKPKGIVLHCTATPQEYSLENIFKDHIKRNFDCIGYHYVIKSDGTILNTRPLCYYGAHAKGYNNYVGIAYIGGYKKNDMTDAQIQSMGTLIYALMEIYMWNSNHIILHNEISNKECPRFDRSYFVNTIMMKGEMPKEPNTMIQNLKAYGLCVHDQ